MPPTQQHNRNDFGFGILRIANRLTVGVLLFLLLLSDLPVHGQSEEVELLERVLELVDQLNSGAIEDRDAAQNALIALQPEALDYIDVPGENATTDFINRLLVVRKALEAKAVQAATQPTVVTLEGKFSVQDALHRIVVQTKNNIALQKDLPPNIADAQIDLELKSVPFWDAVYAVMHKANLEIDIYGGRTGQIALVPIPTGRRNQNGLKNGLQDKPATPSSPRATSGVLAVELNRVDASRILNASGLNYTTLHLLIRWEPRMQPITIELNQATLKIVDDQNQSIQPLRQTPITATVETEIPELNFPVNIPLVDREIKRIKSVAGTLDAVLPGRTETFRFRDLKSIEDHTTQTKSGATVTYQGTSINEELFGVSVALSFDNQSKELDSHLGWAFDNEVYLVDPDNMQIRHDAVAYETVAQDGQKVAVEYYFEVDPSEFDLVYKTPAAIISVSFGFELEDILLP